MSSSLDTSIAAAIETSDALWFPGLAPELANSFVASRGFIANCGAYGTLRWLEMSSGADRDATAFVSRGQVSVVVEQLPPRLKYRFGDVSLQDPGEPSDVGMLTAAFGLLDSVPSLSECIDTLVRSVHILESQPHFDASFSDPSVPFSIFVSLPQKNEADAMVRLAESIVHEAMHLQLTLIELNVPLITTDRLAHSPWKKGPRPAQGVLHGLYVFAVLYEVLEALAGLPEFARYSARRREEIEREIATAGVLDGTLTLTGGALLRRILATFSGR